MKPTRLKVAQRTALAARIMARDMYITIFEITVAPSTILVLRVYINPLKNQPRVGWLPAATYINMNIY